MHRDSLKRKTSGLRIIAGLLSAILIMGIVTSCGNIMSGNTANGILGREEIVDRSEITKICELATLRCYYHNVAEYEKRPEDIFKHGLFRYGYKRMWIEYSGIVDLGIDASAIKVGIPDQNGNIKIYIPEAKVLNVTADKKSLADPVVDVGVFTKISSEEEAEVFAKAQNDMREKAEQDQAILNQARNNAKELIQQYIINVGDMLGKHYEIAWED